MSNFLKSIKDKVLSSNNGEQHTLCEFNPTLETHPSNKSTQQPTITDFRGHNELLTKLILARRIPTIHSLTTCDPQPSTRSTPLKLTLFNGFTNTALLARYKEGNKPAGLVYCSAGMVLGQLSGHYGTHFAQEESTVVENPLIAVAIDQALQLHHNTTRTTYPFFRDDEARHRIINENKPVITPAFGYAIDQVIPTHLNNVQVNKTGHAFHPSTPTLAYVMQAAIHLGFTHEDEGTNYMFATNPSILAKLQTLNEENLTPEKKQSRIIAIFAQIRNVAMKAERHYDSVRFPPSKTHSFNESDCDLFSAMNFNASRMSARIALKTLLFSSIDINPIFSPKFNSDQYVDEVFDLWLSQETQINNEYLRVVEKQIVTQMQLTKEIGSDIFITGLFGCGVYNADYHEIAQVYGKVLQKYGAHLKEFIVCNRIQPESLPMMTEFCTIIKDTINGQ